METIVLSPLFFPPSSWFPQSPHQTPFCIKKSVWGGFFAKPLNCPFLKVSPENLVVDFSTFPPLMFSGYHKPTTKLSTLLLFLPSELVVRTLSNSIFGFFLSLFLFWPCEVIVLVFLFFSFLRAFQFDPPPLKPPFFFFLVFFWESLLFFFLCSTLAFSRFIPPKTFFLQSYMG